MRTTAFLAAASLLSMAVTASAAEVTKLQAPDLPMGSVSYPNGKTMDMTVGFGSGATHGAGDPDDIFYTITDRGPNIDCGGDARS